MKPKDPALWCQEHPDAIEYHDTSGYRRIPLTTCVDDEGAMDKLGDVHPCKGHEEEFNKKHGISGVALFFAIVMPIGIAAAVGWYVYRNWSGKFGQIRLGEQGNSVFEADKPWVQYPIIVLSAVVAVVVALPVVASSLWRMAKSAAEKMGLLGGAGGGRGGWGRLGGERRFTTRDSFARGRGDYAVVDDDEGELLGEDSDEEA